MTILHITSYSSETDAHRPIPTETTWENLVALLSDVRETDCWPCPGKTCSAKRGRAWSPVRLRAGVGAVSAIGAGINATFRNVREALAVLTGMGVAVLGLSTSSFRISLLIEEGEVPEAMRQLHRRLIVDEVTAPEA